MATGGNTPQEMATGGNTPQDEVGNGLFDTQIPAHIPLGTICPIATHAIAAHLDNQRTVTAKHWHHLAGKLGYTMEEVGRVEHLQHPSGSNTIKLIEDCINRGIHLVAFANALVSLERRDVIDTFKEHLPGILDNQHQSTKRQISKDSGIGTLSPTTPPIQHECSFYNSSDMNGICNCHYTRCNSICESPPLKRFCPCGSQRLHMPYSSLASPRCSCTSQIHKCVPEAAPSNLNRPISSCSGSTSSLRSTCSDCVHPETRNSAQSLHNNEMQTQNDMETDDNNGEAYQQLVSLPNTRSEQIDSLYVNMDATESMENPSLGSYTNVIRDEPIKKSIAPVEYVLLRNLKPNHSLNFNSQCQGQSETQSFSLGFSQQPGHRLPYVRDLNSRPIVDGNNTVPKRTRTLSKPLVKVERSQSENMDFKPGPFGTKRNSGTIFIHYIIDSEETKKYIESLVVCMGKNNFNIVADIYDRVIPVDDKAEWIYKEFIQAEFILVCISPQYRDVVEGQIKNPDNYPHFNPLHAYYIHRLMEFEFDSNVKVNHRFVPVLLPGTGDHQIPQWLRTSLRYQWPTNYQDLFMLLWQPHKHMFADLPAQLTNNNEQKVHGKNSN